MDRIGIDITGEDEVLHLGDGRRCRCCHDMVKVPGSLSIFQVPLVITHIGMDEGIVEFQGIFEDTGLSVDDS